MRATFSTSVAAAFASCVIAACRPAAPTVERNPSRVVVTLDLARAVSRLPDPTLPSWALDATWPEADARDAFVVALGEEIVLPIGLSGPLDLTSAFALRTEPGGDRDELVVEYEMQIRSKLRDEVVFSEKCTFHDAAHAWRPLHVQAIVRPEERAELVLVARAAVASPGTRVCFTPPRWSDTRRVKTKPNVLVISIDALRADHMSGYGHRHATTPRIDTLLAQGVRFENAVSVAPWTLPSYGTLFTGLMPMRHRAGLSPSREQSFLDGGALEAGDFELLDARVATLAERFAQAGYRTAGFVSNPFLDGELGIGRGFERWVMYVNRAAAGVELTEEWIRTQGSAPWFAFVHLMDPHAPYTPPPPYDENFAGVQVRALANYPPTLETLRTAQVDEATRRTLAALYDGEIASTDAAVGKLIEFLDARGLSQDTLIVFHSDHGEEFWDHGGYEHGHSLHKELLHVPLAFVFPGRVPPGRTVKSYTSTLDVFPTILALTGLEPVAGLDGVSLIPSWGEAPPPARDCLSEALLYGAREQKAILSNGLKLITDGGDFVRLFDLAADPRETRDLAPQRPEDVARLKARLVEYARSKPAPQPSGPAPKLSPERREQIEKLGYPGPAEPR